VTLQSRSETGKAKILENSNQMRLDDSTWTTTLESQRKSAFEFSSTWQKQQFTMILHSRNVTSASQEKSLWLPRSVFRKNTGGKYASNVGDL